MKIYYGTNTGPGPQIIWVLPELMAKPYRLRHYVKHSPDGFQWGYGGSGPAARWTKHARDLNAQDRTGRKA